MAKGRDYFDTVTGVNRNTNNGRFRDWQGSY
ncbi:hypothetical protein HNQ39_005794 [Armatimonas rosea]|uniref:Uncharacterized protein n=1 Tax=Armatimonas rosea TaxID=685828 RepID=A0A7W9SW42_ARMRO|nr:hypothetical protein [Armatimonas rosea]